MLTNPYAVWFELALKTGEMFAASSQVIGHRVGRMAAAGPILSARDQREFTLMGQEKLDASTESAQAMIRHLMKMNQQMGMLAYKQMLAGSMNMMTLASTSPQSNRRKARLLRDTVLESSKAASQMSDAIARMAQDGLKPIHTRARGNAKRLGKIKK